MKKTFDQIVSEIFSLPEAEIGDNLTNQDISGWDSMNYIMLIAELEKNFDISFSMDEVMSIQTIGDIRSIVEKKQI